MAFGLAINKRIIKDEWPFCMKINHYLIQFILFRLRNTTVKQDKYDISYKINYISWDKQYIAQNGHSPLAMHAQTNSEVMWHVIRSDDQEPDYVWKIVILDWRNPKNVEYFLETWYI